MLTSRFAMWLAWGDQLTFFCNDAYLPTLGVKQEWALGTRADVVWEEIWKDIGPRIAHVLSTGEATWDEGLLLFLERSGYVEETYHTFSYSPVADDDGIVAGMLCVVTEDSERVVSERRLQVLRDLAARTSTARTTAGVCAALEACLSAEARDLPFALTALHRPGQPLQLAGMAGFGSPEQGERLAAQLLTGPADLDAGRLMPLEGLEPLPQGAWDRPPVQALALPLQQQGQAEPLGLLVMGLNPYRPLDDAYRGFLDLFAGQVAAALASAAAYQEARQRAEALAELDRAKTAFFSNVSHEFRTPLTLMLGPLEELLAHPGNLDAAQRSELQTTHRNALRLLKLVNTMLDFTRIEAGRADATFRPTDLPALTTDLASAFRSLLEGAGLRYTVEVPDTRELAYVDPELWEKIVLNLLSNAYKFTLQGGIDVRLQLAGGHWQLQVQDSGTGIPAAEQARVFERFSRVEGASGRSFEGTGIGLALVRELVQLHGGDITLHSVPGEGSTFTVTLPRGRAHLAPDRVEDREGRAVAGRATLPSPFLQEAVQWADEDLLAPDTAVPDPARPRLLLADDNADLRAYVARLLGSRYALQVVADGQQALEAALADPPDLVLSDVMMPRLDGFGLLQALRAEPRTRHIPVILLSARAGEEARLDGLEAGADDYLVKPFSARELRSRVGTHLELSLLRHAAAQAERERSAELERRVQERTAELEAHTAALDAFVRYTEAVGSSASPSSLIREALTVLQARFSDVSVAFYDLDDGLWKARFYSDTFRPELLQLITSGLPADLPVFSEALRTRQPLFVDAWNEEEGGVAHSQDYGTTSLYPLLVNGEVVGMLSVALKSVQAWSERDRAVVRAVGRSLNLALERTAVATRLEVQNTELEARTRALESFASLTRDLTLQVDPLALVRRAQEVALSLLPEGYAAYYEPGNGRWRLLSQVGDRLDEQLQRQAEAGLPFDQTPPLDLPWASRTGYYESHPDPLPGQPGAVAALPLLVNGEMYGIFGVALYRQPHWSAAERTVLETVSRSLGLAVERALSVAQLEARTRELERSNQELEQFAYVASHDLQEPLRSVTSFSQLLVRRYADHDDERAQQYVRFIEEGTSRMAQLIQDLLAYSRVARSADIFQVVPVAPLVARLQREAQPRLRAAGAEFRCGTLPDVTGDPAQVRQLFELLLDNAVKFRDPARPLQLQLTADREGPMVRFELHDTGIGIAEEYFQRIFVIFQRLHARHHHEGNGIGLAIARKIVEHHGGQIGVRSVEGEGSVFWFTLPSAHGGLRGEGSSGG
ncbi:ATP-binding protein [Deinococcus sonorensis]|uniref:histidine kinase n=2 Tax=Deinococcus sonorensis TaxID=309891 RepID=A0AAU7U5P2_9DEIO